jgi:hypothetical protein
MFARPVSCSPTRASSTKVVSYLTGQACTTAEGANSSRSARRQAPPKVSRDIDEDVRDHVPALANTEAFQQSRRERKKVEMRFAHMKRILKLDRLRLRGLSGVRDEVLLTATAQNRRRLVKLICRAPPPTAVPCVAWARIRPRSQGVQAGPPERQVAKANGQKIRSSPIRSKTDFFNRFARIADSPGMSMVPPTLHAGARRRRR